MPRNLTDILEEIRFEYDLGYEPIHEQAILRTVEILKERKLDEAWTEEIVKKRVDKFNKEFNKGNQHGIPM
jgi:hypothetical protein